MQEILSLKHRKGSVLTHSTILKRDHFGASLQSQQEYIVEGAPNFRCSQLNVYGTSQPTIAALQTILTLLDGQVLWFNTREEPVIYICGQPYVLRDKQQPYKNISTYTGISSSRLEEMELRLKHDIQQEIRKTRGLLVVCNEQDGELVPSLVACGHDVKTSKEVFIAPMLEYYRVPVSPEQPPENRYVDEYVRVISQASKEVAVVFNCGLGVGRTAFGMVCGVLVRLMQAQSTQVPNAVDVTLKLAHTVERGLQGKKVSAVQWLLQRAHLHSDLKNAIQGNYFQILTLASVLDNGLHDKKVLDQVIDQCDAMVNLREEVLMYRVRYSQTSSASDSDLIRSLGFMERYFILLAFTNYLNNHKEQTFSGWLQSRPEINNMLDFIRKRGANKLTLLRPVEDLSPDTQSSLAAAQSEFELDTLRKRNGSVLQTQTILKADFWSTIEEAHEQKIKGAANFRRIPNEPIFAVAQPTKQGLQEVINETSQLGAKVVWINLREEPLVYINGQPYVLRDKYYTLRNNKSYTGITSSRLILLEQRLKDDVLNEVEQCGGKLLLHEESLDGIVVPQWTTVETVNTLQETMDASGVMYFRVPLTAEAAPEVQDFDQILNILCQQQPSQCAYVLNCQIGIGRSTLGCVIAMLISHWIRGVTGAQQMCRVNLKRDISLQYQIIHSLLRVIKNGLECKQQVDNAIDQCSQLVNIRDQIELYRAKSEEALSQEEEQLAVKKGLNCLHKYFLLIAFQAYLTNEVDSVVTVGEVGAFGAWMAKHQEFSTMIKVLYHGAANSLLPVGKLTPGDGVALSSEIMDVVQNRRGSVLAQQMILKFDHFPGCQKMSLSERIEGAPNFRSVDLVDAVRRLGVLVDEVQKYKTLGSIYGVAMPTKDAIKSVLKKAGAHPSGTKFLVWTSLREEPVLYVNGKPFVLRTNADPVKNLETTGIERQRVESMEQRMKQDVVRELHQFGGRVLLNEEELLSNGFQIVSVWETVKEEDVQTPAEVFADLIAEGYKVDYARLPITDEQAPLPVVFDVLLERCQMMSTNADVIFNCQMGRGRTTTGMVAACILEMIRLNSKNSMSTSPTAQLDDLDQSDGDMEHSQRLRYLRGEYKLILQLLRVLQFGKLSKLLVDSAIDACNHVQNIRAAIYDYKLRLESIENFGTKQYRMIFQVGCNYLIRYFYLIVFASYVLEKVQAGEVNSFPSFSVWLAERREIGNILAPQNQDLS